MSLILLIVLVQLGFYFTFVVDNGRSLGNKTLSDGYNWMVSAMICESGNEHGNDAVEESIPGLDCLLMIMMLQNGAVHRQLTIPQAPLPTFAALRLRRSPISVALRWGLPEVTMILSLVLV